MYIEEAGRRLLHKWFGGLAVSSGSEDLSTLLLYHPESADFPSLGLFLSHKVAATALSISSSRNLIKAGNRKRLPFCYYFYQGTKTF